MTAAPTEAAAAPAIEVQGLVKRFGGRTVVEGLTMRVEAGRIHGFLGPNGSGKTTTLRMLCGLLTVDGGSGHCLGLDIRTESARIKRLVGYMTQRFSLYEDLSIQENLAFVARVHGLDRRRERVEQALEGLGLVARRRQLAGQLSGGWKQRLALAACTLHQPRLLLLDEPTAGVDPEARRRFWSEIHKLAAGGVTVLVSTHYMDEAERCHEIAYLAYGRLLAQGRAAELVAASGLVTRELEGPGLERLAGELDGMAGIAMVAAFGERLHVGGEDAPALDAALAPWCRRHGISVRPAPPTLEDVFIHLTSRAAAGGAPA